MPDQTQLEKALQTEFLAAIAAGRVCLHPTDTLPGLTCDPRNKEAVQRILAIKGYLNERPFVHLCAKSAVAKEFFLPLPGAWAKTLEEVWPAPLSVVWQSKEAFHSAQDSMAIRVPKLTNAWFQEVLLSLAQPMPSTSINVKGGTPATNWQEASDFLKGHDVFIPPAWSMPNEPGTKPSTLIKLAIDGSFELLRAGAYPVDHLTPLNVC